MTINTNYRKSGCSDAVFSKAYVIKGKDPKLWRKDDNGRTIKRDKLNSKTSRYAWNIDHIIPTTRCGSDDISNLQPLNRVDNIRYSNKLTEDKPNYNRREHHNAILYKNGKSIKNKKPKICIGDIIYARQSPIGNVWSYAKIIDIDTKNDKVIVYWLDSCYEDTLLYDSMYFDTNFII